MQRYRLAIVTAVVWAIADWALAVPVVIDPGQGGVTLAAGGTTAAELSGITFAGGTTYYAVGDDGQPTIWELAVALDAVTGWITSAAVTGGSAASLGSDSEGIAFRAATGSVFVADEVASTIREFRLADGSQVGSVAVPAIFAPANVQANRGLESLAYGPGGLWTANEEAVLPDGPLASTTTGSWVRIQRFGVDLEAAGQWAYRTDPISALSGLTTAERSGVVDVLPWSATELLVLERELGGAFPRFRSRLYLVDTTLASDVSDVASLESGGFSPLAKTLLWERLFSAANFEGMTFGPPLADGSRSLLLISDNGGGLAQQLYAVSVVPEPSVLPLVSVGAAAAWWVLRRRL
jgi:hypothetical protein